MYRRALDADPNDVESLHMLGVVQFERRRYREAYERAEREAQFGRFAEVKSGYGDDAVTGREGRHPDGTNESSAVPSPIATAPGCGARRRR